jgi:transposase
VRSEQVSWAEPASRFTAAFEEMVAYLAQVTDKTQVTRLQGIAWATVGSIVSRVVERRLDPSRLVGLRRIGVDEFSYRRRHRYLTVVVDHDRRRLVWAAAGNSAETLERFFDALGPDGCKSLECVTIDMSAGYEKAIRQRAPQAQVIFDRFHVQRLASDAVDAVRREQLRELRGTEEGRELFRSRFALLKSPWNLTPSDEQKLHGIQGTNARLYRAYLLKETLVDALEYAQPWRVKRKLRDWLAWASRSRLRPFVGVARTIRKHFEGILAYAREHLTNGLTEGINNHLRMVARRAYGFHSADALIAMAFLCCGGIRLEPPLPT